MVGSHAVKPLPVVFGAVIAIALVAACSSKSPSASPAGPSGSLTAPAIAAPADDQQLDTLRPTLVVSNASGSSGAVRTYDFQVAANADFSSLVAQKLSVAENSGGQTSVTLDADLVPSTRYYWRVRVVAAAAASGWTTGKFRTKIGGYNRVGELFDPLTDGSTVGERFGSTTFVAGKGLRLDTLQSYVQYQLPATVQSGEYSMEVEGLAPNGPGPKLNLFSMAQGTTAVTGNPYEVTVQYRGTPGNPDNCISFKAVWGNTGVRLEPDVGKRNASIFMLDPSTTYYWQASWTSTTFRLVVKQGAITGSPIYDYTIKAPGGTGPYAPSPHVAYLGTNAGALGTDTGSFPGLIVRNVWLGATPRPTSLASGQAIR